MGRELVADVDGAHLGIWACMANHRANPPSFRWCWAIPVPCSQSQERDSSKLASVYPVTDSLSPCRLPLTSALLSHSLTPTPDLTPHLSCPTHPAPLLPHPHQGSFLNPLSASHFNTSSRAHPSSCSPVLT